jgi:hypothetical protein
MSANKYHFVTRWRFEGTPEEIFSVISRPEEFPRWWGSVYLEAEEMEAGDVSGLGRSVRFRTKGLLPYRLHWQSRAVEIDKPRRLMVEATGDLAGRGSWYLEQDQHFTDVMFDWQISADKPLLRYLSWLLKPMFRANHHWAMEEGRRGLEKELRALRAASPGAPGQEEGADSYLQKRAKRINPPAA